MLYEQISDCQFLYNRLQMLSSQSIPLLAKLLGVEADKVMQHPNFEVEGNRIIDRITF